MGFCFHEWGYKWLRTGISGHTCSLHTKKLWTIAIYRWFTYLKCGCFIFLSQKNHARQWNIPYQRWSVHWPTCHHGHLTCHGDTPGWLVGKSYENLQRPWMKTGESHISGRFHHRGGVAWSVGCGKLMRSDTRPGEHTKSYWKWP